MMLNWMRRRNTHPREALLELIGKYEAIFPRGEVEGRTLPHVLYTNSLSEKGDLHRDIRIHLRALNREISHFIWRVPHFQGNPPIGIEVRVDDRAVVPKLATKVTNTVREKNQGEERYTEIQIQFPRMRKQEERVIYLKYDLKGYAKQVSRGLFRIDWDFWWIYAVRSPVEYLEVRTELPTNARIKSKELNSSLSRHEDLVEFDKRPFHVLTISNPPTGNIIGQISYSTASPSISTILSLVAGVAISLAVNFLTQSSLSLYELIVAVFIVTTVIYLTHFVSNRL
jgi:hypothetical protein